MAMNKDKVKEIVIEKTDEMIALCEQVNLGFDIKTIHEFRVTFKYLRSFLRLIRMHNNNKGLKIPDRLKDLYGIAGDIREAQLELENNKHNDLGLTDYNESVIKLIDDKKKQWSKQYSTRIIQKYQKQAHAHNYENLPEAVLSNFLNTRLSLISAHMDDLFPTDSMIHAVRKEAKDILNTTNAVQKKQWSAGQKVAESIPVNELATVAEEIGSYNDERNHIENITNYSNITKNSNDLQKIELIKSIEEPKAEGHKNNIVSMIKDLLLKNKS